MGVFEIALALAEAAGCSDGEQPVEECPQSINQIKQEVEWWEGGVRQTRLVNISAQRNQFINTGRPFGYHPEWGRCVRLKAHVVNCDDQNSPQGTPVYWYYRQDINNRPGRFPPPSALPQRMQAGFGNDGTPNLRTEVGEDGWTNIVEFHLSAVGGDIYSVYATTSEAEMRQLSTGAMRACRFVVWRKIWYEVDYMAQPSGGRYGSSSLIRQATREFERAYIELQETGRSSTASPHSRLLTNHTIPGYISGIRDRVGWSRYIHILFVDAYSSELRTHPRTFTLTDPTQPIRIPVNRYTLDVNDWFVQAEITQSGSPTRLISRIDSRNPEMVLTEQDDQWEIYLNTHPSLGLGLRNARVTVRLTFKYWVVPGAVQLRSQNAVVIPMRWMQREGARLFDEGSSPTRDEFAVTCLTHELGHAIGLASYELPDGTNLLRQGQTYVRNGTGSHCSGRIGGQRCNMYHNVHEAGPDFCAVCIAVLHGVNLESLPNQPDHNFDY